ncbi:MAG: hypothetical protein QOG80_3431 [Pseudonocardiales bacterium]|nr:hypothetical protein [Pseudonocardiales bacterium]
MGQVRSNLTVAKQSADGPSNSATSGQAELGLQPAVSNQDMLRVVGEVADAATQAAPVSAAPTISAEDLVSSQRWAMMNDQFDAIASLLYLNFLVTGENYGFIDDVFEKLDSDWEDNVAALFTQMLDEPRLDSFAASYHGRATLTTLYEAMITGSVSDFEREQAERILVAKTRQMNPEDFLESTMHRPSGGRTLIFPVRNMRITPGYDDAPLMAHLTDDGKVNVRYPTRVLHESLFAAETATLPLDAFVGDGMDLNPNEIVGIRDYESDGVTQYRPALALIDYANRVEHSTLGKIAQVAIAAATLGAAGPEVGAADVVEEEGSKWAARLALADRVANVVQVVSFFVHENRDWLIEHLGPAGKALVRVTDVADSVVGIYGLGRLGHAGFTIARDLRSAAKAARQTADGLSGLGEEGVTALGKIEETTEKLAQEMDQAAAADLGHAPTPATGVPVHIEPELTPAPSIAPGHAPTPATGVPRPALGPGGRLPRDYVDEAIDALESEENPFTLNVGARRMQDIQSGERDFVVDRPIGFDIDEPLPVGAEDVSPARAVQRALDPHNRQLLDPLTNQRTKYLGISPDTVARNRMSLAPVSVVDEPAALLTRRFDEVSELNEIFNDAVSRVENAQSLTATELKNRVNANTRRIIYDGLSPEGIRVRDALGSMGFEVVPGRGMVMVRPP